MSQNLSSAAVVIGALRVIINKKIRMYTKKGRLQKNMHTTFLFLETQI